MSIRGQIEHLAPGWLVDQEGGANKAYLADRSTASTPPRPFACLSMTQRHSPTQICVQLLRNAMLPTHRHLHTGQHLLQPPRRLGQQLRGESS